MSLFTIALVLVLVALGFAWVRFRDAERDYKDRFNKQLKETIAMHPSLTESSRTDPVARLTPVVERARERLEQQTREDHHCKNCLCAKPQSSRRRTPVKDE